jgi:ribosomal protein S18 acetylase RimI-like enzyme
MDARRWAIRAATEADLPTVLALWREAGSRPSATDDAVSLRRLLARDAGALLLAEAEEVAIGSLIATWDGWRGSLYRLAVDPGWRRRGVAASLVEAGEERLRAMGAVRLTAIVVADEAAATDFWAAVGYHPQPGVSRFLRMLA